MNSFNNKEQQHSVQSVAIPQPLQTTETTRADADFISSRVVSKDVVDGDGVGGGGGVSAGGDGGDRVQEKGSRIMNMMLHK